MLWLAFLSGWKGNLLFLPKIHSYKCMTKLPHYWKRTIIYYWCFDKDTKHANRIHRILIDPKFELFSKILRALKTQSKALFVLYLNVIMDRQESFFFSPALWNLKSKEETEKDFSTMKANLCFSDKIGMVQYFGKTIANSKIKVCAQS